jgi:hypothetical protein
MKQVAEFQRTKRCYIPDDRILRRESRMLHMIFISVFREVQRKSNCVFSSSNWNMKQWIFKCSSLFCNEIEDNIESLEVKQSLKITIFWDVAQCSPYTNQRFGGIYHLLLQGQKSVKQEISESRWLGRILHVFACAIACAIVIFIFAWNSIKLRTLFLWTLWSFFTHNCFADHNLENIWLHQKNARKI